MFCRGERVALVRDGLSAHWSRAMRAWVAEQDWLTLERSANLADVADATEQGVHRINANPRLPRSSSPIPA
ncbi:hypothetical protein ACGF5T_31940 [Streptomyces sp. NPDC047853]|uniref:hypothetical protein n=1 Tax=unclassified Streptomyces TaxID=2593676 RepID=UPI003452A239